MSGVALKIRYLKKKVKDWTRDRAQKLKRDYLDVVDEISSLLSSCPSSILSVEDVASLQNLRDRKFKMLVDEILT